eukprot:gene13975-15519_t
MQIAHTKTGPTVDTSTAVVDVANLELVLGMVAAQEDHKDVITGGFERMVAGAFGAKAGADSPHVVQQATLPDHADELSSAEGDPATIHGDNLNSLPRPGEENVGLGKIVSIHVEIAACAKLELGAATA